MMNQRHTGAAWRRTARLVSTALLCSLAFGVSGCEMLGLSSDTGQPATTPQPKKKPAKKKADKKKADDKKGEDKKADVSAEEYERPEYPENMRRNPFAPDPDVLAPVGVAVVEETRKFEPLEKYSISQLELVAIISEVAVPKAMFIDPDGFGHLIKEGDRIGRQGGTVKDIRDNEVDVLETTGEDENAQSSVRTIRLTDTEIRQTEESSEELSDAERQALDQLLRDPEARKELRSSLRERALEAGASEREQRRKTNSSGIAPPVP